MEFISALWCLATATVRVSPESRLQRKVDRVQSDTNILTFIADHASPAYS